MIDRVTEKAFAKINLYLHVLGKNEKGYHLLDSLFVFSDIGDEVSVLKTNSNKIDFKVDGDFKSDVPENDTNLVIKMCHALDINKGISVVLHKNLPVSSGIGGGSADAGAVMRALTKMFDIKLSSNEVIKIATSIGADVPACVFSKSSLISGIGEQISDFPIKKSYKVLLINPLIKILTKDIFKVGVKSFSKKAEIISSDLIKSLKKTRNDLLAPALSLVPEISEILTELNKLPCLYSNMSGSGATSFALFDDNDDLEKSFKTLQKKYPNYWIRTGNLI